MKQINVLLCISNSDFSLICRHLLRLSDMPKEREWVGEHTPNLKPKLGYIFFLLVLLENDCRLFSSLFRNGLLLSW